MLVVLTGSLVCRRLNEFHVRSIKSTARPVKPTGASISVGSLIQSAQMCTQKCRSDPMIRFVNLLPISEDCLNKHKIPKMSQLV